MDLDKKPRNFFSTFSFPFFLWKKYVEQTKEKKKRRKRAHTLKSSKFLDFKCRNDDGNVKEALRYIGISRGDFGVESDGK